MLTEALRHPATPYLMLDIAELRFDLVFESGQGRTKLIPEQFIPEQFNDEQRAAAIALAGYDAVWGLGNTTDLLWEHGLPTKREELRAFLGLADG